MWNDDVQIYVYDCSSKFCHKKGLYFLFILQRWNEKLTFEFISQICIPIHIIHIRCVIRLKIWLLCVFFKLAQCSASDDWKSK